MLSNSRHRLLFTSSIPEGVNFIDLGNILVPTIASELGNRHLSMIAEEALEKVINGNVVFSEDIGLYIAITNIGVLFEPALQLNLESKFSKWSRTYTLIIDANEGTIVNNRFYLAGSNQMTYSVDLSSITYNLN